MLQRQLAVILAVKENRRLPRGLKTGAPDGSVCVLHLKHRNTKRRVVYRSACVTAPRYLHTGAQRRTNTCTQREAWPEAPCCAESQNNRVPQLRPRHRTKSLRGQMRRRRAKTPHRESQTGAQSNSVTAPPTVSCERWLHEVSCC